MYLNVLITPISLICVGILHANNSRDIESDLKANSYTIANMIGLKYSYYYYIFLILSPYSIILLNYKYALLLLNVPLGLTLIKTFRNEVIIISHL